MRHVLEVSVKLTEDLKHDEFMAEWNAVNGILYATVNDSPFEAGTGFGCRDMEWEFETLAEAEEARKRLEMHDILRFEVLSVRQEPDTSMEARQLGWDEETIQDYWPEESN